MFEVISLYTTLGQPHLDNTMQVNLPNLLPTSITWLATRPIKDFQILTYDESLRSLGRRRHEQDTASRMELENGAVTLS